MKLLNYNQEQNRIVEEVQIEELRLIDQKHQGKALESKFHQAASKEAQDAGIFKQTCRNMEFRDVKEAKAKLKKLFPDYNKELTMEMAEQNIIKIGN